MSVKRQREPRRTPAVVSLPVQLLAVAAFLDGHGNESPFIRRSVAQALRDAEATLRAIAAKDHDSNYALDVILDRVAKSDEFRKVVAKVGGNDLEASMIAADSAEQGLWLGMALAYRYFGMGGAR